MRRFLATVVVLGLAPALAPALEITNIRPSYGPQGAPRPDNKCLPGDVLWIEFDIDGLKFDDKTGKASYETKIEFLDSKNMQLFERKTPNETTAQLGGNRMPGDLHVVMGTSLDPGKYSVKLTVTDKLASKSTSVVYPVEVLPKGFGFIRVAAPALGLPGTPYLAEFALVGAKLDNKNLPSVDVSIKILDANLKPVVPAVHQNLPEALPAGVNVKDLQFVPMSYPLYLNRAGRFYIDIMATDKNANNKQAQIRIPLTVLDISAMTGTK